MKKLSGQFYKDIVIKRENRVRPLSAANSSIRVREKDITIDPLILYQNAVVQLSLIHI